MAHLPPRTREHIYRKIVCFCLCYSKFSFDSSYLWHGGLVQNFLTKVWNWKTWVEKVNFSTIQKGIRCLVVERRPQNLWSWCSIIAILLLRPIYKYTVLPEHTTQSQPPTSIMEVLNALFSFFSLLLYSKKYVILSEMFSF